MDEITGKTLLAWGYKPGGWFGAAIAAAEQARRTGAGEAEIRAAVDRHLPAPAATLRAAGALAHRLNIAPEDADEIANVAAVEQHMTELMRVPTVRAGAVMPDACPAGSAPGTIPVGGVVAAENAIHPGMHSADICCSLAVSIFRDLAPKAALDAAMRLSHFGGGGRPRGEQLRPPADVLSAFAEQRVPESARERRHRALRDPGRRQSFFLCRPDQIHGRCRAGDPSRLAQARSVALQGGHGGSRKIPAETFAADAAA